MRQFEICQSCSMPLTRYELFGTEQDGTLSEEYCIYCYKKGRFTEPDITLDEMENRIRSLMKEQHMAPELIKRAIDTLPHLKRWRAVIH